MKEITINNLIIIFGLSAIFIYLFLMMRITKIEIQKESLFEIEKDIRTIKIHQSKQLECLKYGYFDYDSETDSCYILGKKSSKVPLEFIKEYYYFGEHCDILSMCKNFRNQSLNKVEILELYPGDILIFNDFESENKTKCFNYDTLLDRRRCIIPMERIDNE